MKKFVSKLFMILLKLLIALIKIFVCISISIFVGYFAVICGFIELFGEDGLNWQILLYIIISMSVLLGTWLIAFIKSSKKVKIIYVLIFLTWFFSHSFLPSVNRALDLDICIDTGDCRN